MNFFSKSPDKSISLDSLTELLDQLRLPTALVFTPINLASERKKFFSSSSYSPQFKYRIVNNNNKKVLAELSKIQTVTEVDPRISDFYINLIKSKVQANELMHAVGQNALFTEIGLKRFRMPSEILFRNACRAIRGLGDYKIFKDPDGKESKVYHYDEVAEAFKRVFEYFGLIGWTVNRSQNIGLNGVKVGIKKQEVLMDPNIKKRAFALRKTIVHEMTHVLRAYNGSFTGFDALKKPNLPMYLDVEEGLAGYNEEQMKVFKKKDLIKRAGKVWAAYVSTSMSFREVYNGAMAFAPKYLAFDIAYRVKRGLSDTSQGGMYTKDVVYFRGYRRVRKKISEDETLYAKLFAGKISFSQIKWVDDGLIPKAKIVPIKSDFDKIFSKIGV
ncbi:DUF1704 domain-containing protein [Candidatus Dojkabacteria bacterium]|uniref:DUF1704 domain-containing protein n=1 Tax=Candidatus Dojkabacteria bacterium TaxID=2099670 RepID=A0A955HZA8_9BACT|nr:DUF1704 domain-containing protein [Candidatus Dojkabacteria bacterium]